MSNTKAFTYPLGPKPNGVGVQVSGDEAGSTLNGTDLAAKDIGLINQTSPTWVLTFVRWDIRDTLRTPTTTPEAVRQKLIVVENDCLQVTVSDSKGVLTPNMVAILVETDINYSTAVHPGDFVFVNILNWETDARRVADQARDGSTINGINDGFKGFFKVQSVRKIVNSDPATGIRTVLYKIDGFAFTEFNNTIYFNPNLINQKDLSNVALYISDMAQTWSAYVSRGGQPYVQEILAFLIQNLIGSGPNPKAATIGGLVIAPNVHFFIPIEVGNLLGVTNAKAAKDVYSYLFGIQKYSSGLTQDVATGMNPSNLNKTQRYPGFNYTSLPCQGNSLLKPEYWDQVKLWSILNQYTNSPLNELYTCFRVSPTNGQIMPTLVFRQIPFTSQDFIGQKFETQDSNSAGIHVTYFLTLPRWKIGAESVYSLDIGTDEAARVNFVQYYAKSNFSSKGIESAGETAQHNYTYDKQDVARSGLRPIVIQNQFDDLPDRLVYSAPRWARILGDALIGMHLKLNGTIKCFGIIEPIAVGDNLEFDNVVYHIEQLIHTCSIDPITGNKTFRTDISLSHGVSVNSDSQGTKYPQMTYSDAYTDRNADYSGDPISPTIGEQILPGISESQDVPKRPNLDRPANAEKGQPFQQPSINKNTNRYGE
jgi:hypothetical protein